MWDSNTLLVLSAALDGLKVLRSFIFKLHWQIFFFDLGYEAKAIFPFIRMFLSFQFKLEYSSTDVFWCLRSSTSPGRNFGPHWIRLKPENPAEPTPKQSQDIGHLVSSRPGMYFLRCSKDVKHGLE